MVPDRSFVFRICWCRSPVLSIHIHTLPHTHPHGLPHLWSSTSSSCSCSGASPFRVPRSSGCAASSGTPGRPRKRAPASGGVRSDQVRCFFQLFDVCRYIYIYTTYSHIVFENCLCQNIESSRPGDFHVILKLSLGLMLFGLTLVCDTDQGTCEYWFLTCVLNIISHYMISK